jgi:hypothetical protein
MAALQARAEARQGVAGHDGGDAAKHGAEARQADRGTMPRVCV